MLCRGLPGENEFRALEALADTIAPGIASEIGKDS